MSDAVSTSVCPTRSGPGGDRSRRSGSARSRSAPTCSSSPGYSPASPPTSVSRSAPPGLTVTVFALAYATGAPVLSALLGARPLRQVLIGSLVLFGLCNVVSALAPTLAVLLVARVLGALAASVYVPAAGAAAVAAVPGEPPRSRAGRGPGRLVGRHGAGRSARRAAGVRTLSWRAAFGLVAVLAAVTVLGLLRSGVGPVR